MTRTALALSPHLDDAAFSAGGVLSALARAGWRVVVATVFTRSMPDPQGFALACQLDKGLPPEADYMALRRAEDSDAMTALGVEAPLWLDLPEAPHRGYGSAPALFAGVLPTDAVRGDVDRVIRAAMQAFRPDLVLAPQSIGGHADHIHVTEVARTLDGPVAWWSDHPYDGRPEAPRPIRFDDETEHLAPLAPDDLRRKLDACAAYRTQLGFQFGGPEQMRVKLGAVRAERFRGADPRTA